MNEICYSYLLTMKRIKANQVGARKKRGDAEAQRMAIRGVFFASLRLRGEKFPLIFSLASFDTNHCLLTRLSAFALFSKLYY